MGVWGPSIFDNDYTLAIILELQQHLRALYHHHPVRLLTTILRHTLTTHSLLSHPPTVSRVLTLCVQHEPAARFYTSLGDHELVLGLLCMYYGVPLAASLRIHLLSSATAQNWHRCPTTRNEVRAAASDYRDGVPWEFDIAWPDVLDQREDTIACTLSFGGLHQTVRWREDLCDRHACFHEFSQKMGAGVIMDSCGNSLLARERECAECWEDGGKYPGAEWEDKAESEEARKWTREEVAMLYMQRNGDKVMKDMVREIDELLRKKEEARGQGRNEGAGAELSEWPAVRL